MVLPIIAGVAARFLVGAGVRALAGGAARATAGTVGRTLAREAAGEVADTAVDAAANNLLGFNPLDPMGLVGELGERTLGFDPTDPLGTAMDLAGGLFGDDEESDDQSQGGDSGGSGDDQDNSVLDNLADIPGLGPIAGLLIAAIQALAEAGDGKGNGNGDGVEEGSVIPVAFQPLASAYSSDDKGASAQETNVLAA